MKDINEPIYLWKKNPDTGEMEKTGEQLTTVFYSAGGIYSGDDPLVYLMSAQNESEYMPEGEWRYNPETDMQEWWGTSMLLEERAKSCRGQG